MSCGLRNVGKLWMYTRLFTHVSGQSREHVPRDFAKIACSRLCVLCVIGGLHNRGSWNFIGGIRYVGGSFRGFGAGRSRSVDKPSFGLLKGVFLEERRVAVVERAGGIVDAMIGWKGWLCGSVCRITRQRTLLTDGGIALIYRTGWHGEKSAYPHRWQIQSPEEDCEYYLVSVR